LRIKIQERIFISTPRSTWGSITAPIFLYCSLLPISHVYSLVVSPYGAVPGNRVLGDLWHICYSFHLSQIEGPWCNVKMFRKPSECESGPIRTNHASFRFWIKTKTRGQKCRDITPLRGLDESSIFIRTRIHSRWKSTGSGSNIGIDPKADRKRPYS